MPDCQNNRVTYPAKRLMELHFSAEKDWQNQMLCNYDDLSIVLLEQANFH